jgi:uncharacterized protein with HEPN domain
MEKTDAMILTKILADIDFLVGLVAPLASEDFAHSIILSDCCCFRLIPISENARRLSPAFYLSHPDVPLKSLVSLRNRTVHDYGQADLPIIFLTIKEDLPSLRKALE